MRVRGPQVRTCCEDGWLHDAGHMQGTHSSTHDLSSAGEDNQLSLVPSPAGVACMQQHHVQVADYLRCACNAQARAHLGTMDRRTSVRQVGCMASCMQGSCSALLAAGDLCSRMLVTSALSVGLHPAICHISSPRTVSAPGLLTRYKLDVAWCDFQ